MECESVRFVPFAYPLDQESSQLEFLLHLPHSFDLAIKDPDNRLAYDGDDLAVMLRYNFVLMFQIVVEFLPQIIGTHHDTPPRSLTYSVVYMVRLVYLACLVRLYF